MQLVSLQGFFFFFKLKRNFINERGKTAITGSLKQQSHIKKDPLTKSQTHQRQTPTKNSALEVLHLTPQPQAQNTPHPTPIISLPLLPSSTLSTPILLYLLGNLPFPFFIVINHYVSFFFLHFSFIFLMNYDQFYSKRYKQTRSCNTTKSTKQTKASNPAYDSLHKHSVDPPSILPNNQQESFEPSEYKTRPLSCFILFNFYFISVHVCCLCCQLFVVVCICLVRPIFLRL